MQKQNIIVSENADITAGLGFAEPIRMRGFFKLEKFERGRLIETIEFPNLVVNVGGALMLDKLIGGAGTVFSNANAHIGIGDSATAPAVGQTDLVAATNKLRKAMDATFPSRSGQVMTFKSTFGTGDANYLWNEIALFNAAAAGDMFSRSLVTSPFTKTSALSIVATYTLTCP
jgi:hypothetical protein